MLHLKWRLPVARSSKRNRSAPEVVGGWKVGSQIGAGGNGTVYRTERNGVVGAIKLLRDVSPKRTARFADEVQAMRACGDISGVLPVLDAGSQADGIPPWFVMGLATTIDNELFPIGRAASNLPLQRVVEAMASIASTLDAMHQRGISHRDIKPDNLFFFNGAWTVGDFGLVSFEGKTSVTAQGERIGPIHFIAPEMLNDPIHADGRAADVFSFAKTLWVLATRQNFPIPGAHDLMHDACRIGAYVAEVNTGSLDKLIAHCTALSPEARPSMAQVANELRAWLEPSSPEQRQGLAFDLGDFRSALVRLQHDAESAREREAHARTVSEATGLRLRESLRPLAVEIESSFLDARFFPVSLNIEGYRWGFEVQASVSSEGREMHRIVVRTQVETSRMPTVEVWCRITAEEFAGARVENIIAQHSTTFLEGGSDERRELVSFAEAVRDELARTVPIVVASILEVRDCQLGRARHSVEVRNRFGNPVPGATVLLIAVDGNALEGSTDREGRVEFLEPTSTSGLTALVAHPDYRGIEVRIEDRESSVTLEPGNGEGSVASSRTWTSIPGVDSKVNLIHDRHGRKFAYSMDGSFNDGAPEPFALELGQSVKLQGMDGRSVFFSLLAVRGRCFLLRVRSP